MDYSHEDFEDILSDTSSTGFDEKISPQLFPTFADSYLSDPDFQFASIKNSDDSSITYLCEICHKNIIKLEDQSSTLKKKRKRTETQLIVASMKVCDECKLLDLNDLKKISGPAQCKRVIKRDHAKRRMQELENLKNLKDLQEKQIDDNKDLTENEKKKLKQVIRNRISAQQSRDRKKVYIKEIEQENQALKQQASSLKHKIQTLNQENQYLKNQLAQIHIGGNNYSAFKGAGLGIATLLSVFLVVNSLSETSTQSIRQLSASIDLNNYKNPEGVSLQKVSDDLIDQFNKENTLVSLESYNSIVEYRKQRVDIINDNKFLKKYEPCENKIDSSALTTLFCPNVQAYWENEADKNELKHLQVIIPLESMPGIEHTIVDTSGQKYLLEILCSVSDVNVLPISNSL